MFKKLLHTCRTADKSKINEILLTIFVFAFIYIFIFASVPTKYLFTNTDLAGGDTGSHIYIPWYAKEIFPKIKWWSPDWYSGFPFLYFYPPLLYTATVVLSFLMPLAISFKWITFISIAVFPLAAYLALKFLKVNFPGPQIGAAFITLLMFFEGFNTYGGNWPSTLAGQFTHTFSIALFFVFVGLMYKGIKENRYLTANAILGAMVILAHPISGLLLIALAPFFFLINGDFKKKLKYIFLTYFGNFLLSAFWTLSMVWYKNYSGTMSWTNEVKWSLIAPHLWFGCIVLAFIGLLWTLIKRDDKMRIIFPIAFGSMLLYLFLNHTTVWNTRFLPYYLFCVLLLAAYGFGLLGKIKFLKKNLWLLDIILILTVVLTINFAKKETTYTNSWFKWNYEGYQAKGSYNDLDILYSYIKSLPPGRVMWEYRPEYDKYGTPRVLETIPMHTGHPTFEGLLIESGLTGPFHFINQAETTKNPTTAIAGFEYPPFDFTKGIKHLQASGAEYFVAYTEDIKTSADSNKDLTLLKNTGAFNVYRVNNAPMVEPINAFTIKVKTKDWLKKDSVPWYTKGDLKKPIIFTSNLKENTLWKELLTSPRTPGQPVTNIITTNDSLSFDAPVTGIPYVVKISYFPTWKVTGAKGPYLVSPAYMAVIPTQTHVTLKFSYGFIDYLGYGLTLLGIPYLVFVSKKLYKKKRTD
jgi:hypothetical protein